MSRRKVFDSVRRGRTRRRRFPVVEALEERSLLSIVIANTLNDPQGVTTDQSADVYVSYNDYNIITGQQAEAVAEYAPSPSGGYTQLNPTVMWWSGPNAFPGPLVTLGTSESLPFLNAGDILEMQPNSKLFSYRPSTGVSALYSQYQGGSFDASSVYNPQTGNYQNLNSTISLSSATFGDFGVDGSNILVSGEANGWDFVARQSYSQSGTNYSWTYKILVAAPLSPNDSLSPWGLAVNAQGEALTCMPDSLGNGTLVAFSDGSSLAPSIPKLGLSTTPTVVASGITLDGTGNFVVAANQTSLLNGAAGYVTITPDLLQFNVEESTPNAQDSSPLPSGIAVLAGASKPWQSVIATVPGQDEVIKDASQDPLLNYAPTQIRHAYGVDNIPNIGSTPANGAGQTIAIVEYGYDPTAEADLEYFSQYYRLPEPSAATFSFAQVYQTGTNTFTPINQISGTIPVHNLTIGETALDVEWAHAIAPEANILVVEADPNDTADGKNFFSAIQYAANQSGVSAVSISYGWAELMFGTKSTIAGDETTYDADFTHAGVTFLVSSGDTGAYGDYRNKGDDTVTAAYPASSPDVVAVGGTNLSLNADNTYASETGWGYGKDYFPTPTNPELGSGPQGGSGGGLSIGLRAVPDVAWDSDPATGFNVYTSTNCTDGGNFSGWFNEGGTSDAAPQWAGLIAIVDQQRAAQSEHPLTGYSQTLPALYSFASNSMIYARDFHDITSGDNGYPAGTGYDLVTGVGTPIANNLVPDLANYHPTITWANPAGGDWNTPGNWVGGVVPGIGDDAVIPSSFGNITITYSSGTSEIHSLTDAGTLKISAGTFQIDAASTATNITQTGGTLTGAANLTVSGTYAWSGGTQSGTGTTILASGAQMNITGSVTAGRSINDTASGAAINWTAGELFGTLNNPGQLNISTGGSNHVDLAGTLNNTGTITWTGGGYVFYFDGGTLNNLSGGTFNNLTDLQFYLSSGSPQITNAGTFEKTVGTGTTYVAFPFSNSGTVDVESGTVSLAGGLTNFSGTTLTGGTYLVKGTLQFPGANIQTNAAMIVLNGAASQILNSSTGANGLANFAANAAGGSFTIQNGRNFTTAGAFSNAGNVAVGSSSTFTASGNYTQTAGDTDLQGGTLAATGLASLQGGLLSGSGTVSANVTSAAQVGPGDSAGTISITGNYTQTSAGTLNIELGGVSSGQFDQLKVSGSATLDGALNVSLINGFAPTPPQQFQVLTFGSRSGDFATKTGLVLSGGLKLNPLYSANSLTLVTSAPASSLAFTGMPTSATAGTAFTFTVTAYDAAHNVATGYTGTIHFTSSDSAASLPADYTFKAGDAGTHSFTATLNATGSQTITATDTVSSSITGSGSTTVSSSSTASAVFLSKDTTTQGNWIGVYGTDGYDIINNPSTTNPNYLPTGVTVTPAGATSYTWANPAPTTAKQALEVPPSGTTRIAACWYSATSFTVDVNVASGSYNLELYFLDYNGGNARSEQIQLSNASTGAVLSTQTVASFSNGVYMNYTISGNVLITITKEAGANAVLSGLFFDPTAAATASATFLNQDTTTQGNWIGVYGTDGYDIINNPSTTNPNYLPTGVTVTAAGEMSYTWANPAPTTAKQALEVPPSGTTRIAACWYSATSFTVDVNVASGSYNLELYFLDYNGGNARSEQIQLCNASTGAVLSTQTVSSFSNGAYMNYTISGNVLITITKEAGANAVLSGLFFDPTAAATASATFLKQDTTTQGNWIGVYGTDGYDIINNPSTTNPNYLPMGVTVTAAGQTSYTWANPAPTTAKQALEVPPSGTTRVAATWYSATSFTVDVNVSSGSYNLELYFLDYNGGNARSEQIQFSNASTGAVLSTQTVSSFSNGAYMNYTISGNVLITITKEAGANAVLSGLFFDAASS